MKTIKIKGKDYVEVNERIKHFRSNYPNFSLSSRIVEIDAETCIIKAEIRNESGDVVATGHAHEEKSAGYINKTSFVENCETSAWGRALGNFGIGIDTSIASADEVDIAIKKQNTKPSANGVDKKTKLTKKQFDGMMQFIIDGKKAQVMSAMKKYDMSSEQSKAINEALLK